MKVFAFVTLIFLSNSLFSRESRELSPAEKVKINKDACETFSNIYGHTLKINLKECNKSSAFRLVTNDKVFGTYIFGKLVYNAGKSKNCNMTLVNDKISAIDCSDE